MDLQRNPAFAALLAETAFSEINLTSDLLDELVSTYKMYQLGVIAGLATVVVRADTVLANRCITAWGALSQLARATGVLGLVYSNPKVLSAVGEIKQGPAIPELAISAADWALVLARIIPNVFNGEPESIVAVLHAGIKHTDSPEMLALLKLRAQEVIYATTQKGEIDQEQLRANVETIRDNVGKNEKVRLIGLMAALGLAMAMKERDERLVCTIYSEICAIQRGDGMFMRHFIQGLRLRIMRGQIRDGGWPGLAGSSVKVARKLGEVYDDVLKGFLALSPEDGV